MKNSKICIKSAAALIKRMDNNDGEYKILMYLYYRFLRYNSTSSRAS